jgi:glycerophosphoryl diester phosphodiesterase
MALNERFVMDSQALKLKIAKHIRKRAEKLAEKLDDVQVSDLMGMCAIASSALEEAFNKHGFLAEIKHGTFEGNEHCWVECEDEIWDITATQFNDCFPKVYVTSLPDIRYEITEDNNDFKWWPKGQQPLKSRIKKIISGLKIYSPK